jgi:hypothetical protein
MVPMVSRISNNGFEARFWLTEPQHFRTARGLSRFESPGDQSCSAPSLWQELGDQQGYTYSQASNSVEAPVGIGS